jgi:hypothetical protein
MNFGFILTSALNTRFGVFNTDQRLAQTLDTVKSIRDRVPDAHITLLEMAGEPLKDSQRDELQHHVNVIFNFTDDTTVKEIYKNPNWDIVKNSTEILCFQKALTVITEQTSHYSGIDRFFKISGRYLLNDSFKIDRYLDPTIRHKAVIGKRRISQFPPKVTENNVYQYMSRCWSFDASLIEEISSNYSEMYNYMVGVLSRGGYIDIEHCLFRFLDPSKVVEEDVIGVQGLLGPNGITVRD